jgi:putative glutamine amidotransferase
MATPLVGLTSVRITGDNNRLRDAMSVEYSNAIARAGGIPVLVPLAVIEAGNEPLLRSLYERLDGILIPGGGDVHPEYYGEFVTDYDREISRSRDRVELTLARWAFEDNRPLLGICRGHQVINVALGGTLMHDIYAELNGSALKHDQDATLPRSRLLHEVEVKAGSQLGAMLGCDRLSVNSLHHQAIRRLASPLNVTAVASDGVIEAVEAPGKCFYLGVQWHPEAMLDKVPTMQALFAEFVRACAG